VPLHSWLPLWQRGYNSGRLAGRCRIASEIRCRSRRSRGCDQGKPTSPVFKGGARASCLLCGELLRFLLLRIQTAICGRTGMLSLSRDSESCGGWRLGLETRKAPFGGQCENQAAIPMGSLVEVGSRPSRLPFATRGRPDAYPSPWHAPVPGVLRDKALSEIL
jgi:hypothetical protein